MLLTLQSLAIESTHTSLYVLPVGDELRIFKNKNRFHNLLACTVQMVSTLGYFAKTAKVNYNILLHRILQTQSAKGTYSTGIWNQATSVD